MKIILVFFVVFSYTYAKAQTVSSYKLPIEIKNEFDVNGNQTSAIYYSQIGLDSLAIYSYSEGRIVDNNNNISFNFCPYRLVPFYEYIEKIADDYDIIIINEAHHKSYDRQVINKLIKVLHNKNYKNYGMETFFTPFDIEKMGFPVKETGYYIADPEFAQIIRTALNLNYSIFGYECGSPEECPTPDLREEAQSQNIFNFIDNNNNH